MIREKIVARLEAGSDDVCECPQEVCCRKKAISAVWLYGPVIGLLVAYGQTWLCCGNSHRPVPPGAYVRHSRRAGGSRTTE